MTNNTSSTSPDLHSPAFGDFAAEYEEWGQPQRAACQRLVAEALPLNSSRQPSRLLDVGAGTGFIRDALDQAGVLPAVSLFCLDTSQPMLRYGARKPGFIPLAADAVALPFADQSFDHVFSSFTLHWLAEPAVFFRAARRALRPGGGLHLAVPVTGSLAEFRAAVEPVARAAAYELQLDLYPESGAITALAEQAGFHLRQSPIAPFSYSPDSVRDMLAFMRYAGAGRFVRPRHSGDFLRFALRLHRHAAPAEIRFQVMMLHAENIT